MLPGTFILFIYFVPEWLELLKRDHFSPRGSQYGHIVIQDCNGELTSFVISFMELFSKLCQLPLGFSAFFVS